MIGFIAKFLGGNLLQKTMGTVDRFITNRSDQERIKADVIMEHYRTRGDFMRSGGFWLMLIFAVPLAIWWAAVILYSILWCARCAFPQSWTIAALPAPLDDWAAGIVLAIFGVIGVSRVMK